MLKTRRKCNLTAVSSGDGRSTDSCRTCSVVHYKACSHSSPMGTLELCRNESTSMDN